MRAKRALGATGRALRIAAEGGKKKNGGMRYHLDDFLNKIDDFEVEILFFSRLRRANTKQR